MYWDETSGVPSSLILDPRVAAYLKPNARVLDLGCGAGRMLGEMAGTGRFAVGADRNFPSLAAAADQGCRVVRADLAALPFADDAFDAGIIHAVLTTLNPRQVRLDVLAEARRVGCRVLCVADFLQNWDLPYYTARYEAGLPETGEAGSFVVREEGRVLYTAHHFTLEELEGLFGAVGYRVAFADTPKVRTRSGKTVTGVVLAAVADGD
ncbi:Methyltransferase type 11 [Solidesulfovibrio fructosivorans JJ]]|uniref:Methyltransferase type 11 n=1 Tax=Solidesulfovibrio fructosivorans JJ] TaxID=596151 RepID=E1JWN9_SOLFR|nr:class I SAM-dependent methyltransferase [Solidesulfovibrio fructosivorans]EFL51336.1 Methyltransferase type 11 [Solidesulfovibrio fructosivorans JJ]]